MRRSIPFGLALLLAVACSDDPTGPAWNGSLTSGDAEISSFQDAQRARVMVLLLADGGSVAASVRERMAAKVSPVQALGPSSGPPSWAIAGVHFAVPECSITESGVDGGQDPIDANGNGVPDDFHRTLECVATDTVGADSVRTERGSLGIVVRERPGALRAYDLTERNELSIVTSWGMSQAMKTSNAETLTIFADRATLETTWSYEQWDTYPGDPERHHRKQGAHGEMEFTPEGTIVLEATLPDGEMTVTGDSYYLEGDLDLALRSKFETTEPLLYSGACGESDDPWIVGGVLRGWFDGHSDQGYTLTFNSCGNAPDFEAVGFDTEEALTTRRAQP